MTSLFADRRRHIACLMAAGLLCGCAAGPDFQRPAAPDAHGYAPQPLPAQTVSAPVAQGASQHFATGKDLPFDWWTLFQSPQLNALVERAFRTNPTVEAAQAALRQAQENVVAQQGFFYPTVGVSYSPSRTKLAGNMGGNSPGVQGNGRVIQTYSNSAGPAPYNAPVYYNFHVAQLTVGYVPDVFGANRRQLESATALAHAQQFQLEATYITLASNVVGAALQEATLRMQISAMQQVVTASRKSLDISRQRFRLGDVSGLDVAAQEAALAQAQQALLPLQKQLEQTRDLLRALAGNAPDRDVPETFQLASLHLPQELPLSLPSRLVEQRPDVRAAEEQLHAASAEYGVAIANRLPQFAVTGAVGGMAATPGWMFRAGGGFFNLAADISQTIFDGGTLHARSRAAQQALAQAAAQYRSTVIAALQNVADTLHAIDTDAAGLQAAAQAEQAACKIRNITRQQYDDGYVSYQDLLAAEQDYQLAVFNLAQAQATRLGDTAALYVALGGGWWHRPDANAALAHPDQPLAVTAQGEHTQ